MHNFFEHQDKARRQTTMLVGLFVVGVVAMLFVPLLGYWIMSSLGLVQTEGRIYGQMVPVEGINPVYAAVSCLAMLAVILFGTFTKLLQLRQGGKAVAEMMGATRISQDSRDPQERQLLNVVEEMCIAAGIGMLPVYVMRNERAINAFAAGYHLNDAVVAVTQGTLDLLNRSELQGVIGHELSHVLNGDMRLNIRIIGVLHGIMLIGMLGYHAMNASAYNRQRDRGALLSLGLALVITGYVGVLFANLIRAAVSRQREFLADASSVQFTRNPEGIASALIKISKHAEGSRLRTPNAREASHLLFGSSVSGLFGNLMATHPPLVERIKRLKPSWQFRANTTTEPESEDAKIERERQEILQSAGLVSQFASTPSSAELAQTRADIEPQPTPAPAMDAGAMLASVGTLSDKDYQLAQQRLQFLNQNWQQAAREVLGARALLYKLLLVEDEPIYQHQLQHIGNLDAEVLPILAQLGADAVRVEPWQRLLYIDLALPQLRQMSADLYQDFLELLNALIRADKKIELFEWCMYTIIKHYLDRQFAPRRAHLLQGSSASAKLEMLATECNVVFSLLCIVGTEKSAQQSAYQAALEVCGLKLTMLKALDLSLDGLSDALDKINQLHPLQKPKFLKACVALCSQDGAFKESERELLRAIAESIDCPIPPSAGQ